MAVTMILLPARTRDGVLVLRMEGTGELHQYLPYPVNQVVVNRYGDTCGKEKIIFAKFIIDCDMNIRASEGSFGGCSSLG